jgi:hypothetical protein
MHKRLCDLLPVYVAVLLFSLPVTAFAQSDVMTSIETFFDDAETVLIAIAGSVAIIGMIGIAMMYMSAPIPIVSTWKKNNPEAIGDVVKGLVFLILVSGGTIAALAGF